MFPAPLSDPLRRLRACSSPPAAPPAPASVRRRAQRASPRCDRPGRCRCRPVSSLLGAARLGRSGARGGGPAQVPQRPHRRGVAGRRHGRTWCRRARSSLVTWAPTTELRRRSRGFDHAEVLARKVAARLGLPCWSVLARVPGPPQTGRTLLERREGPQFLARRTVKGASVLRRGRRHHHRRHRRRGRASPAHGGCGAGRRMWRPHTRVDRSTIRSPSPSRRSCRCRSRSVVATRRYRRA